MTGLESGDIAYNYLDVPGMFFPLQITNVSFILGLPDGGITDGVWAVPYFLDGAGENGYSLESVLVHEGRNIVSRTSECEECHVYFWEGQR